MTSFEGEVIESRSEDFKEIRMCEMSYSIKRYGSGECGRVRGKFKLASQPWLRPRLVLGKLVK